MPRSKRKGTSALLRILARKKMRMLSAVRFIECQQGFWVRLGGPDPPRKVQLF